MYITSIVENVKAFLNLYFCEFELPSEIIYKTILYYLLGHAETFDFPIINLSRYKITIL